MIDDGDLESKGSKASQPTAVNSVLASTFAQGLR